MATAKEILAKMKEDTDVISFYEELYGHFDEQHYDELDERQAREAFEAFGSFNEISFPEDY